MNCFKKGIILQGCRLFPVLFALVLLAVGTATAATYRDDIPVPFSQIVWDHPNISGWPITSDLATVYIEGGQLYISHSKRCSWPLADAVVNANSWVIHKSTSDNRWHANTWDFMRQCQESKGEHDVGAPSGWTPSSGEEVYFFISGIARPGYEHLANVSERTNIVKYYWHGAAGKALPALPTCVGPPVINSFTANPNPVFSGVAGMLSDDHNVELSWSLSNGDSVKLVADTGESAETTPYGPFINSLPLYLPTTHKFTLYGINECTPEAQWPTETIEVVVQAPLPFLAGLILYNGADVETLGTSGTTVNSSFLYGTVNPHHQEAKAIFEFGTTAAYGRLAEALPKTITGGNKTTIAVKVTGLKKGTLYHYRAKAKLRDKVTYGIDRTFTTDDVPTATTDSASPVNAWSATLRGTVNPNGNDTSVKFYYAKTIDQEGKLTGVVTGANGSALDPVDGSTEQNTSVEVSNLQPNTTYYYKVCATNSVGGPMCGDVVSFLTYAPPEVVTDDATNITETTATLHGRVDPNRKDTTVRFQWRTSSGSYNEFIPGSPETLSGDGLQSSTLGINGLTRGTDYYYRIVAWNQYGADYGGEKSFTADDEPGVTTEPPTILSHTEATLRATISPHGAETRVYFEWSGGSCTTPATWYNEKVAFNSPIAEDDSSEVAVLILNSLKASTSYCYRAFAENGIGGEQGTNNVYGDPIDFTTPPAPAD
jgi:hypothetical protein